MPRVLMLSPHFPPDASAAAHRVRLLAPHLSSFGWEPTVVTVDPRDCEGRLDPELADLLPPELRVIRCRAWPPHVTRRFAVGDLGLRAYSGLRRASIDLLARERFDALFITIYPTYPALLGPLLKRRFRLPFVLDYQDPWIGAWGRTVGPGLNGRPDRKSRLARAVAVRLEPRAVRAADAITAVSAETYEAVRRRYPGLEDTPCLAIPVGGDPRDFAHLGTRRRGQGYFDPTDGRAHVVCVGTLLPLGFETLRAVLGAAALLRDRRPESYARVRFHFFGTSNQTDAGAAPRVLAVARELGVGDCVTEVAPRIGYLDALSVQTDATAILMIGSTEPHYTASKLYPGLFARRPVLAVFHETSSVVEILRRAGRPPAVRLVTYSDRARAGSRAEAIYTELVGLIAHPVYDPTAVDGRVLAEFSAEALAGRLAALFDRLRRP
jgi:glycosyltransferase involved in cell wall biosynthesis